jgi:hypothetical protein
MVSGKEWKLPMVVKFWQPEERKEEKDLLFPARNLISNIWLINRFWLEEVVSVT